MRRVGVLFLSVVVLAGSVAGGCATSEPTARASATASPSQSPQEGIDPASPSGPPGEESTRNAETPRTDSSSDPYAVEVPPPVGVSLSELEAMVIDPLEELRKAGIDIRVAKPYGMTTGEGEGLFTQDLSRPWFPSKGLVVGYRREACTENLIGDDDPEGERGRYAPFLSASVLAFDSTEHAREYVDWQPRGGDKPVRVPLPPAGAGVVSWRSGSGRHFTDVALIRRENLVGRVVTVGFTTDGHREAIGPLVRALGDQMEQVNPRARPYDAAALLAAPLPSDAWTDLGDDGSTYPKTVSCPDAYPYCDVESMWGEPAYDAPTDSSASPLLTLAPGNDEYPVLGTELIAYTDESAAADAMGDMVARWLSRKGGEEFTVPGVSRAVGVRTPTLYEWREPLDGYNFRIGDTWSVLFTHGSALARAFIVGGPKYVYEDDDDDTEDTENPADSTRNRQWVIDAAQAWQARLDIILG